MFTKLITLLAVPALVAAQHAADEQQAQVQQDPIVPPDHTWPKRFASPRKTTSATSRPANSDPEREPADSQSAKAQLYPSVSLTAGQGTAPATALVRAERSFPTRPCGRTTPA